ncbi:MAG: flagellar biosynthetic protein FliR [Pseudomonadota bacterium]
MAAAGLNTQLIVPVLELQNWILDLVLVLVPVSAFILAAPVFGNAMVPTRVKAAVAVGIAIALQPVLPVPELLTLSDRLLLTLWQSIAGLGLGFATLMFFQIFVIAGQFVGMQMGLGFASMVDPGNGLQVTVWSQFYLMLATLCFLSIDGHLLALEVLVRGLSLTPALMTLEFGDFAWQLAILGGWMFAGGASIALPAVFALLVVNLAFGVMSRSAPQLNIFSLGFPFSLLFGLLLIWWTLSTWLPIFDSESTELLERLVQLVG